MRISYPQSPAAALSYLVRRFAKNSVSGLYSEEMRSSRGRALEWAMKQVIFRVLSDGEFWL